MHKIPIVVRTCGIPWDMGVNYPGAVIPRSVPVSFMHSYTSPAYLTNGLNGMDIMISIRQCPILQQHGCMAVPVVNTSLFGIGERTGNTPLEAMVFEYAQLKGTLNGMDTRVITELAEYYEKEIGYQIPPRTPFVGKNFNVTRAGIHADGLLKE